MATIATAFLWGLGVSCGAAIGLLVFLLMKSGLEWSMGIRETNLTIERTNRASLAALLERNKHTEETNELLDRIADSLETQTEAHR